MKNKLKKVFAALLTLTCLIGTLAMSSTPVMANQTIQVEPVYRLYNPNSGEHFLSVNKAEISNLVTAGWTKEGIVFYSPLSSANPIYRLYNSNTGNHIFVASATEKNNLANSGWSFEGIAFYAADNSMSCTSDIVYGEYNPNSAIGAYNYTSSYAEHYGLINSGWVSRGDLWIEPSLNDTNVVLVH